MDYLGLVGTRSNKLPSPASKEDNMEDDRRNKDDLTSLGDQPASQDDASREADSQGGSNEETRMTTPPPYVKEEDRMVPDIVRGSSITPGMTGEDSTGGMANNESG